MPQTIFIQLTTAGPNTGPFDIYSIDSGGIVTGPFETNISRTQLLSGFVSVNVPNNCVRIRLVSKSVACPNILELPLPITTTTTAGPTTSTTTRATTSTTSTSSTSTSTSSTTTAAPTTTTTTIATTSTTTAFPGYCYSMFNNLTIGSAPIVVPYVNASGVSTSVTVAPQATAYVCGLSYTATANMTILSINTCNTGCPGTTSTTSTSTSTTSTSTTSTTTTLSPVCNCYTINNIETQEGIIAYQFNYYDCDTGLLITTPLNFGDSASFCANANIITTNFSAILINHGICGLLCPPPTTTSSTTTTTTASPIPGRVFCYSDIDCDDACLLCLGCRE
jgi:hypothetical protein